MLPLLYCILKIMTMTNYILYALLSFFAVTTTATEGLKIGDKAPKSTEKLQDISGKTVTLKETAQANGLLVIFSCNTCPFVVATQDRYREIQAICKEKNIGIIAINSNEAQRGADDSVEAMKKFAADNGYEFPYVVDENSVFADAFGATKTPDIFLFDKDLKLVYKGSIDNNHRDPTAITDTYLKNAIGNLVNGQPINPNETKAVGCTIKRKS